MVLPLEKLSVLTDPLKRRRLEVLTILNFKEFLLHEEAG